MLASRIALAWARTYTLGLSDEARRTRIDELASDLWDHAEHAGSAGRSRRDIQLAVVSRTARGAWADLAWRSTHRSGLTAAGAARGAGWTGFALAAAFLLFFTGGSGAPVVGLYTVEEASPGEAREFARVTAVLFVTLAVGLALLRRQPLAATTLIAVAGGGVAAYVPCLWPMLVPAALACTAGAGVIAHGRRRRNAGRPAPASPRSGRR